MGAKNGTKEITFRNVFGDAREFSFTVDHAAFAVSTATQNIAPRTEVKTTVSFKPPDASELHKGETEIAGKLFVRCLSPDFASFPPWVLPARKSRRLGLAWRGVVCARAHIESRIYEFPG